MRSAGVVAMLAMAAPFALAAPAQQGGFFGLGGPGTPPRLAKRLHKPVPARLIATLTKASQAGLALEALPEHVWLKRISGPRVAGGNNVGLLYLGAEFCPYCAAQRWGLLLVLLRFGELDGLRYMLSSSADVHPDTPTVTFAHATYQSANLVLQAVETADRDRHPLATHDQAQQQIVTTFDAPPYVRFPYGIPFVYLDGRYMLNHPMLMPQQIHGMNWQQIAAMLANRKSLLFQTVMPHVNLMTAAICQLDGGKPADVCTAPGVAAAKHALSALSAPAH